MPRSWNISSLKLLTVAAILLSLPAMLINLGSLSFIDDEGIRALVALEMRWSENYIVPTLNGSYYFNKPPLYNWILLGSFNLFGTANEWTDRLPTIFFLGLFVISIYLIYKRELGWKIAFLTAFATLTCGRFLFWDSFRGLIDTAFSFDIFLMFICIIRFTKKEQWWKLFLSAYALAATGFLLKAFPAIIFVGLSLLAMLIYRGRWRRIFSIQHIAGVTLFAVVVGSYYVLYHVQFDLFQLLPKLFDDSVSRTPMENNFWSTLKHALSFPLEMTYHFLPWSLLIGLLFWPGNMKRLFQNDFVACNAILFVANIWIYWISPEIYPRYLLMFSPLIFHPSWYYMTHIKSQNLP